MILLLITIIVFIAYALLLLYYAKAWEKIPILTQHAHARTKISVVVPARNEEENIGRLLDALEDQSYPRSLFEVIVVDDHSTDQTAAIARSYPGIRLISLQEDRLNSYKKKAIETGIAAATGELIVSTDADCIPGTHWLSQLAGFREKENAVLVVAPVQVESNGSLFQQFQSMDFMMLQGITGVVVHRRQLTMCNGANLAYLKKVFGEVGGFAGIDRIASGDDMLLMHKIATRYPDRISYLKSEEAIVNTRPADSWKAFFRQRIRWASKARHFDDKRILPVLLLLYLFNCLFLAWLLTGFWSPRAWIVLAGLWVAKTAVEYPLLHSLGRFFKKPVPLLRFFLFQPLHILYSIISGLLSQFGKYEWKGRIVR